jgi:hypothetical protein
MGTGDLALALGLCMLAAAAWGDTFVSRKTGERVSGRLMGTVFKDGHENFYVKTDQGKRRMLPQDEWERRRDASGGQATPAKGRGREPSKDGPDAAPRVRQVEVTGSGTDPEQAKQSAFSNAIEQTVGVLVDAETLVKNDELIRDQILTYSRGYVKQFTVIKEWQEDGLHHARIRADVAVTKLVDRLKTSKIPVRDVPGELLYRQGEHEIRSEDNMEKMLAKALASCGLDRLVTAAVVEEPQQVSKDPVQANMRVRVALTSDLEAWKEVQASLAALLKRLGARRTVFATTRQKRRSTPGSYSWAVSMGQQQRVAEALKGAGLSLVVLNPYSPFTVKQGKGHTLYLFQEAKAKGAQTFWSFYVVPDLVAAAIRDVSPRSYVICIEFLDAAGQPLVRVRRSIAGGRMRHMPLRGVDHWKGAYFVSPLMFNFGFPFSTNYAGSLLFEETVAVPREDLKKVAKCRATVQEAKGKP